MVVVYDIETEYTADNYSMLTREVRPVFVGASVSIFIYEGPLGVQIPYSPVLK